MHARTDRILKRTRAYGQAINVYMNCKVEAYFTVLLESLSLLVRTSLLEELSTDRRSKKFGGVTVV